MTILEQKIASIPGMDDIVVAPLENITRSDTFNYSCLLEVLFNEPFSFFLFLFSFLFVSYKKASRPLPQV